MYQMLKLLVRDTIKDPHGSARYLLSITPSVPQAFELAVLVAALNVILTSILSIFYPVPEDAFLAGFSQNPIFFAIIQLMLMMISTILVFLVGRMFGGKGDFAEALFLLAWVQVITFIIQLAALPIALVLPGLSVLLNLGIFIYFIYLTIVFIAEIHGFQSLWNVFFGTIATSFVVSFLILMILAMIGMNLEGA